MKSNELTQRLVVNCHSFECWQVSISQLFGVTPKIHICCGNCRYNFSRRFEIYECENKKPSTICPNCGVINIIPLEY